jgi:hypothetical protein
MLPKGSWYSFLILNAVALYGVFDSDFNFYRIFGKNITLSIRAVSYEIATKFIRENLVFGIGIPGDVSDTLIITHSATFSSSDIGVVGVFFNFGVIGVFLYASIIYAVCSAHKFYKAPSIEILALEAVGYWVTIVSFMAQHAIIGQGPGLTALLVAMYLRGAQSQRDSTADLASIDFKSRARAA